MVNMALMIMGFLVLILGIGGSSQPQVLDPENPSVTMQTALCLFNGFYSNIKTVQIERTHQSRDHQDVVNVAFVPVEVPAFQPYMAVYHLEQINNAIYRRQVWVFSELDDGLINIKQYNVTSGTENIPSSFDITTLKDFKLENFEPSPEDCDLTFRLVEDDVVFGSMPDCKSRLHNGQRPKYAMTTTCNAFSVLVSYNESLETSSRDVYYIERYGSRYSYPSYLQERLANFTCPCDD